MKKILTIKFLFVWPTKASLPGYYEQDHENILKYHVSGIPFSRYPFSYPPVPPV